ncbi:MAG TPA: hypothetical protein DCQ31_01785 [Bacteroidales bacterium]|nr:hypothetical protein [Bacteroidales bacterium]
MNYKILIIVLLFLPLWGCEEVIEMDLNSASSKLVIEANLAEGKTAMAKLSLTSNYFDPIAPVFVENAIITIADKNGANEQLTYKGNGIYEGTLLKGAENNMYTLEVEYKGEKFIANSFLHKKIPIDSLRTEAAFTPPGGGFNNGNGGGAVARKIVLAMFQDNITETNFYKLNYYRNDTLITSAGSINVFDDALSNGLLMTAGARQIAFKPGDASKLELMVIDKSVHLYFSTLSNILSSGNPMNSSTPYNPESNFSNGALGYFMAYSFDSKEIEIK